MQAALDMQLLKLLIDDQKSVMVGIMNGEITLVPSAELLSFIKMLIIAWLNWQKYYLYSKTGSMSSSKVFFTNLRAKPSQNLLKKLETLVVRAGIDSIEFEKKIVAVKIHFGEPGNLSYLRPNYAARIVRILKGKGGNSFSYGLQHTLFRTAVQMHLHTLRLPLKMDSILSQPIVR